MRFRKRKKVRKARERRGRARASRRGVLLLVVLSMLVLFMLVGTAFLMSSNQSREQMKEAGKQDRLGNYASRLLDRAVLQMIRDTENPYSVIRYHSLLRDMYGTDGFEAVAYGFRTGDSVDLGQVGQGSLSPRYAGAFAATPRGPTEGQFIDIFFKKLTLSADDPGTKDDESISNPTIDLRNVVKVDRDVLGNPQLQSLPTTRGYYNGCLLTITSGEAAGQSARILDYEFIRNITSTKVPIAAQLFRIRVMSFQRTDGQPLNVSPSRSPEIEELAGVVPTNTDPRNKPAATFMVNGRAFSGTGVGYNPLANTGQPRLSALQMFGSQFGVTGGNFIGAELALLPNSVYFNPLDTTLPIAAGPLTIPNPTINQPPILVDPFTTPLQPGTLASNQYQLLNNPTNTATATLPANTFLYPIYTGAGGANEGYDAADYQNIGLAIQTVTPRSQGRVVHSAGSSPLSGNATLTLDLSDPAVLTGTKDFLRLDLEDLPLPSFHRPDLVNFWYHRLFKYLVANGMNADNAVRAILQPYADDKWTPSAGVSAANAALISAIKRQALLRPTREDHPHFDGSNPQSVPVDLSAYTSLAVPATTPTTIAVPFWEATGPWDVDNDNDGVRDSVWVDLGDPIQETEDGRRYKPMYAILCVDLDSRLNVNAHGSIADLKLPYYRGSVLNPPMVGLVETPAGSGQYTATAGSIESGLVICNATPVYGPHPLTDYQPGPNMAGSTLAPTKIVNASQLLPRGLGYGPGEISLRPVFPIPWNDVAGALDLRGNRSELTGGPVDSYKSLLVGRERLDGVAVPGRYGYEPQVVPKGKPVQEVSSGVNYEFTPDVLPNTNADLRAPDLAVQMKLFEYPWRVDLASAFGTPPDLFARYSLGLNYGGQPIYETLFDRNPNDKDPANLSSARRLNPALLTGVPYSTDLSSTQRRDSWSSRLNATGLGANATAEFNTSLAQNDDSVFSPTDLEKVLRATDPDAGSLPPRLWDSVNDFDPLKLMAYDPFHTQAVSSAAFGSTSNAAVLTTAQETAAINRRLVTTDSFDLPVATQTMPAYVSEFGADGAPGRRNDPVAANKLLNAAVSDDFQVIMAARDGLAANQINLAVSRANAKISDLLYYRVWLEARRYEMNRQKLTEGALDALTAANYATFMAQIKARVDRIYATFPQLASELLAPEVVAGKKMDLNRPFGDGQDNNNDGVVDDPMEAGDPFLDLDGNGKWSNGEPFIDLFGTGAYVGPGDQVWANLTATGALAEPIAFDYTNGHAEPVHALIKQALNVRGGVRNLNAQGRQLFARHLYCLMLLLMDEKYIAPWDEKDPQINKLLDTTVVGSLAQRLRAQFGPVPDPSPDTNQFDMRAREILLRKLTCRSIAQWAANCVDMRDPDVIMTSFEYDENPWDGWGNWDDKWNQDPIASAAAFATSTFLPLDGDPATNENDAWIIDWTKPTATPGRPKTLAQLLFVSNQPTVGTTPPSATNPPIITVPFNQTRGVVWGAERPELLITETLALHDRRTEDIKSDAAQKHDELHGTDQNNYTDVDMDQRLRPKGSLYVELYNPWPATGQFPSELYTRFDDTTQYQPVSAGGVDISRLSNWGVKESFDPNGNPIPAQGTLTVQPSTGIIKRSPVWRVIVVDDWPRARNRDRAKIGNADSQTGGSVTANGAAQFAGYSQRVGDVPPDVKLNLPLGVTVTGNNLPAYLKPMVDAANDPNTVESWDATKAPPYRAPDPDLDDVFSAGFFNSTGVFTNFDGGFNASFTPTQVPQNANNDYPNKFNVEYPYVEREFYFTTDDSPIVKLPVGSDWGQFLTQTTQTVDWDYSPKNFKIRVPDRFIKLPAQVDGIDLNGPKVPGNLTQTWARSQKFIPISLEKQKTYSDIDLSTPRANAQPVLAPIQPGRYGVVGTAGARYFKNSTNQNIYTNPIGRTMFGNQKNTTDQELLNSLTKDQEVARRIEMRPSANPDLQQLVVGSNGGDPKDQIQMGNTYDPYSTEIGRDNELLRDDGANKVLNLTMPDAQGKAVAYQPCVAIPVEGMNVSEPPWGWTMREYQAAEEELDIAKREKANHPTWTGDPTVSVYQFDPKAANGEGSYRQTTGAGTFDVAYDKPFDIAPELIRTGTTPNYRTTHLQRLANPELPWNPMPGQYKDANGTDLHRPNLPVNPYRTIDSSTVNLTAYNGTSSEEHNIGTTADQAAVEGKLRPWERGGGGAGGGPSELLAYVSGLRGDDGDPQNNTNSAKQVWSFKSVERGFWSRLNSAGWITAGASATAANPGVSVPQRTLWSQEPALVDLRKPRSTPAAGTAPPVGELLDLISGRQMTMRMDEVPHGQTDPPATNSASFGGTMDDLYVSQRLMNNHCDAVLKHSLGYGNESFGLLYDRGANGFKRTNLPQGSSTSSAAPITGAIGMPAPSRFVFPYDLDASGNVLTTPAPVSVASTFPWLAWDNRPYVSGNELLKVPAASQAKMMRQYSAVDPNQQVASKPNPYGLSLGAPYSINSPPNLGSRLFPTSNQLRLAAMQAPFGGMANVFASSAEQLAVQGGVLFLPSVADVIRDTNGLPLRFAANGSVVTGNTPGDLWAYGAPNFDRILDYVHVPSRFVGTETMLNAETFNDDPTTTNATDDMSAVQVPPAVPVVTYDPRYFFQPPFNKVSHERDPGKVNLNTVTGRRTEPTTGNAQIWSEVYDGIMHRYHDGDLKTEDQLGHFGPAWRDVVLSRRGYAQFNADNINIPVERLTGKPDVYQFGLNPMFPTMFANPFRSADAGDLVPLVQLMQFSSDATLFRKHPYDRAVDPTTHARLPWGQSTPQFGDARDAGLGVNEAVSVRASSGAIPGDNSLSRDTLPLFSESRDQAFADTNRNPYMMYEPMSRLGNLVTNRSGVYAVWITVGYFEVEKAPDWNDPDATVQANVRAHFGNDINLYNRAYPDGYMLGKEIGSETGDVKRPRGFYIIDRTEEVGFKPGEDLNVEKTIRLRRRIE